MKMKSSIRAVLKWSFKIVSAVWFGFDVLLTDKPERLIAPAIRCKSGVEFPNVVCRSTTTPNTTNVTTKCTWSNRNENNFLNFVVSQGCTSVRSAQHLSKHFYHTHNPKFEFIYFLTLICYAFWTFLFSFNLFDRNHSSSERNENQQKIEKENLFHSHFFFSLAFFSRLSVRSMWNVIVVYWAPRIFIYLIRPTHRFCVYLEISLRYDNRTLRNTTSENY